MTLPEGHSPGTDTVMAEALAWLDRIRSGTATNRDAQAFHQWRGRSPAHDAAFQEVAYLRKTAMGLPPLSKEAMAELARVASQNKVHRRTVLAGAAAVAASVAGFAVVRPPLGLWPSLTELMADHRTAAGERFAFDPTNGVKVEMNTRTSVSLADQGNRVDIVDGESFIAVAARTRDFVAAAGSVHVSTQAGSFNLRAFDGEVCVTCVAGKINVQVPGSRYDLEPDQQVLLSGDGKITKARIEATQVLAWRRGLLVFDNTPLSVVVADVNRYLPGRLVLMSSAIQSRPVNGVFHTAQIQNTITQIQGLVGAHITRVGGVVFLS